MFFIFTTNSEAQPFLNWFGFGQEETSTPKIQENEPQEVQLQKVEPQKIEPQIADSNNESIKNQFSSEFEDIGKHDIMQYDYDYGNFNYYQLHEDNSNEASKSKSKRKC